MLRERVGWLPLYEYRLRATRPHRAIANWVSERANVRRLGKRHEGFSPAPTFSVVLPTYRRPEMLRRAVDSVLSQSFADFELIVVDDGGGGLPDLPTDSRLKVVSLRRNNGYVGVALNVGIALSSGSHLAFLNDDNWWLPLHLETCLSGLQAGADLVYTAILRVDESGVEVDQLGRDFDRELLRNTAYIDINSVAIKRGHRVHFRRTPCNVKAGYLPPEDWEFVWRMSRKRKALFIPRVTVKYLIHQGSYFSTW